jgi:hypothetical protein
LAEAEAYTVSWREEASLVLSSDDFPDRFTHGPPLCGIGSRRFAFVVGLEAHNSNNAQEEYTRNICPNVQDWGQVCRFQGKNCGSFGAFTNWLSCSLFFSRSHPRKLTKTKK